MVRIARRFSLSHGVAKALTAGRRMYLLAAITALVIQPIASLAVTAVGSGVTASGDTNRPTLSWDAVPDEPVSGAEWIKRDGRPAGGAIAQWPDRINHATAAFDNKMWVAGGSTSGFPAAFFNDVWYSSDGITWTQATAHASWAAREHLSLVVFDDKMWVMGGNTAAGPVNDVWYSSDGITWTQATEHAAWSVRMGSAVKVFNDKLWLLSGSQDAGTHFNDVWQSDDGSNWTQVTASADWFPLLRPSAVVYDGKLWIMGGGQSTVWYTANGADWVQAASSVAWGGNISYALGVVDGKMWITGGSYSKDAWTSSDGVTWTKVVTGAEWVTNSVNMAVTYNDKLWLLGTAYSGYNPVFRQVWQSSDGVNWSTPENIQPGSNRMTYNLRNLESVAYKDKLWVIGNNVSGLPEVWVSSDGASWSQVSGSVNLPMRWDYNITVFQDKLWLVGGSDADYNYTKEVWYSTDGASWTQATASAPWPGRAYGHGVVAFNDRLWVIGGESDTTSSYLLGDVWYSSDGIDWTQATDNAPWGPRSALASVVHDNKIWVMGGSYGDNWDDMNDVWYSSDGVNWTQATTSAGWSPRSNPGGLGVFNLNDELWMIGDNDVWKSSDGVTWTEVEQTMLWGNRSNYTTAVFDSRLWAIGGAADGFLTNEVWSTPNRAISYYELCWDQVQGGCSNKVQVSASEPLVAGISEGSSWLARVGSLIAPATSASVGKISYTLAQTLSPGTWFFSAIAVNGEGEESVLGASTRLVVPAAAPSVDNAAQPINAGNSASTTPAVSDSDEDADVVDSPGVINTANDEQESPDERNENTFPLVASITAAIIGVLWLSYYLVIKRGGRG